MKLAIVGGGIAGLFCAYLLRNEENVEAVDIYEASTRLGGRIRTIRFDRTNHEIPPCKLNGDCHDIRDKLEFHAEFGPMRLELDSQKLLGALLWILRFDHAGVGEALKLTDLEEFPAYASPNAPHDPAYPLAQDELGKSPMELFELALLRVLNRLRIVPDSTCFRKAQTDSHADKTGQYLKELRFSLKQLRTDSGRMTEMGRTPGEIVRAFAKSLSPPHLWLLQTCGHFGAAPLYTLGFWNLISDQISHNAVRKIRELGSFYHLLDENPNAAEWFSWWIAGLSISDKLVGVAGGMETIVEKLIEEFGLSVAELPQGQTQGMLNAGQLSSETPRKNGQNDDEKPRFELKRRKRGESGAMLGTLCLDTKVTAIRRPKDFADQIELALDGEWAETENERKRLIYDHVVLAIPRRPLENLMLQSLECFPKHQLDVSIWLDSAFGFPMVKVFGIVPRRWWEDDFRPNVGATQVPTRELHYWKGNTKGSRQGMVMIYTGRPSSALWGNFVASGPHLDVWSSPRDLAATKNDVANQFSQRQRLRAKLAECIRSTGAAAMDADDINWVGIRDWGRDPYGGNHAWRPKRRYWHVMRQLAELPGGRVHVCGEAYSDYHGFIEGSLRSAVLAVSAALSNRNGEKVPHDEAWPATCRMILEGLAEGVEAARDAQRKSKVPDAQSLVAEMQWWVGAVARNHEAEDRIEPKALYGVVRHGVSQDGVSIGENELDEALRAFDECETCGARLALLTQRANGQLGEHEEPIWEEFRLELKRKKELKHTKNGTSAPAIGIEPIAEDKVMARLLSSLRERDDRWPGPELVERVFRDAVMSKATSRRQRLWREFLAYREGSTFTLD